MSAFGDMNCTLKKPDVNKLSHTPWDTSVFYQASSTAQIVNTIATLTTALLEVPTEDACKRKHTKVNDSRTKQNGYNIKQDALEPKHFCLAFSFPQEEWKGKGKHLKAMHLPPDYLRI